MEAGIFEKLTIVGRLAVEIAWNYKYAILGALCSITISLPILILISGLETGYKIPIMNMVPSGQKIAKKGNPDIAIGYTTLNG
jgi:hypothetical protein